MTTTPGRISVIMPCFNTAKYLREAVDSVLGQTYTDVELVVVDDGSTDSSLEVLEEYRDRVIVLQQANKGPYPARNLGISRASGEFIAFLDSDDYWDPHCLAMLHQGLTEYNADLAYCGWQNVGEFARNASPFVPPKYEDGDMADEFLRSCPWPIHAALTRRSVIDAVGGFSERCFSAMDYDLWIRVFGHTSRIVRVPEVLAFYRWHGKQISSNAWRQSMDAYRVRLDFADRHPDHVKHIPSARLWELTHGSVLKAAYRAYWSRDLFTAQKLLRQAFYRRIFHIKDLRYILPSLLPLGLFRWLVSIQDKQSGTGAET
jgi:glycosyltransferase involved in cell wall biosynthesis